MCTHSNIMYLRCDTRPDSRYITIYLTLTYLATGITIEFVCFTYRAEGNHSGEGHEELSEITTSPSAKTIKQTKKICIIYQRE